VLGQSGNICDIVMLFIAFSKSDIQDTMVARHPWLTTVILATQDAEMRRIAV
jgi:hypothetical protein